MKLGAHPYGHSVLKQHSVAAVDELPPPEYARARIGQSGRPELLEHRHQVVRLPSERPSPGNCRNGIQYGVPAVAASQQRFTQGNPGPCRVTKPPHTVQHPLTAPMLRTPPKLVASAGPPQCGQGPEAQSQCSHTSTSAATGVRTAGSSAGTKTFGYHEYSRWRRASIAASRRASVFERGVPAPRGRAGDRG
jgi:hypothetical protein